MSELGYAIGYGVSLFMAVAGYLVAFAVLAEAVTNLYRRIRR